jgi:hypothetical protein
MSDITVGYNKNDFFYVLATNEMPNEEECNIKYKIISDASCVPFPQLNENFQIQIEKCKSKLQDSNTDSSGETIITDDDIIKCLEKYDADNKTTFSVDFPKWKSWQDNSMNCYKKELCKNKENADIVYNLQNNHLGIDKNYEDINILYTNQYIKTFQLSVGILALLVTIFYSK